MLILIEPFSRIRAMIDRGSSGGAHAWPHGHARIVSPLFCLFAFVFFRIYFYYFLFNFYSFFVSFFVSFFSFLRLMWGTSQPPKKPIRRQLLHLIHGLTSLPSHAVAVKRMALAGCTTPVCI